MRFHCSCIQITFIFLAVASYHFAMSSQSASRSYFHDLERSNDGDQRGAIGLGEWLSRQTEFEDLFENDPLELKIQKAKGLKRGDGIDELLRSVVEDESLFRESWREELLDFQIDRANQLARGGSPEQAAELIVKSGAGGIKAYVEVATNYGFIAEDQKVDSRERLDTLVLMRKYIDLARSSLPRVPSDKTFLWETRIAELDSKYRRLISTSKNSNPSQTTFSPLAEPFVAAELPKKSVTESSKDPAPIQKSASTPNNPIFNLRIAGPEDIGRSEAETIFKGMALMNSRRNYEDALKGMKIGYTYSGRGPHRLDAQMKQWVFQEYVLMKKAMEKYAAYPEISQRKTPELYEKWIQKASLHLTALGSPSERYKLLKSLMTQESGKVHWKDFKPTMGSAVDIGFGQFLPATAKSVGINPYDPEENIKGIALYLNQLISSKGMRNGLASYNGGNNPPPVSFRYADSIMSRMG